MFKIMKLDSMPKCDIYLIPTSLHCPKCGALLGNDIAVILNDIESYGACAFCRKSLEVEDFARQFGVIKNISE